MKAKFCLRASVAPLTMLLAGLLLWPSVSVAQSSNNTVFSGRATAVDASVLGIGTVISDTGPLPPEGGAEEASLLEANVPGLLTAEVLHASSVGQGQRSQSEASVASLNLTVGGNNIAAEFLMATAAAQCGNNGKASISGSSEIVGLVINGQQIVATGEPNQTILLPNGRVVINEQNRSESGRTGDITVNALHVVVDGVADVVIASAHADITCGKPVCPGGDFVTGGGWITGTPSGAKGTFAVAGGNKNGALWGHLTYIDHGRNGPRAKGTGVTAYVVTGPTSRHIEGTAEIDGQPGTYVAEVADEGEPGRMDTFTLRLHDASGALVYSASGLLEGGNIQLHQPCK